MSELAAVARIRTEFPEKFGIPRQSGLVPQTTGTIVFERAYRSADAIRGIEGFSHLWLLWGFDRARRTGWSATVRPPRLGGNARMGVFATRSPYRPNGIGLSCVTLKRVDYDAPDGPLLIVGGADLADGTPLYDIKPYLPLADCHPEATSGFAAEGAPRALRIVFPEALEALVSPEHREALRGVLAQDPRPAYQDDAGRVYGVAFAGKNVRFTVEGDALTVVSVEQISVEKTGGNG